MLALLQRVDVLGRFLVKGLVVAGDIKVSLAEVELLTIRIRLLVCSIDKAEQIGLDWWKFDHHLSPGKQALSAENEELRKEIRLLERRIAIDESYMFTVADRVTIIVVD